MDVLLAALMNNREGSGEARSLVNEILQHLTAMWIWHTVCFMTMMKF